MKQDEIIEMARQAGFEIENGMFDAKAVCVDGVSITRELEALAKLIAAKEREACVFDIRMHIPRVKPDTEEKFFMKRAIDRIEARGEA
jgi:hypothetical protein